METWSAESDTLEPCQPVASKRHSDASAVPLGISCCLVLTCFALMFAMLGRLVPSAYGATYSTVDDLAGCRVGVTTGSVQEIYAQKYIQNVVLAYFSSDADMAIALRQGKIDAFIMPYQSALLLLAENSDLTYLPDPLAYDGVAFAFPKTDRGATLQAQMNDFIKECRSDGTFDQMTSVWFGDDESAKTVISADSLPSTNGTIRYGTFSTLQPFCYVSENGYVGLDIDLVTRFCEKYGYGLQLEDTVLPSVLAGLGSGAYDMGGGGIAMTEERAQMVYFSNPYYAGAQVLIVMKDTAGKQGALNPVAVNGTTDGTVEAATAGAGSGDGAGTAAGAGGAASSGEAAGSGDAAGAGGAASSGEAAGSGTAADSGSTATSAATTGFSTPEDLAGHPIGIMTGSFADVLSGNAIAKSDRVEYNTFADAISALIGGKVDAVLIDDQAAVSVLEEQSDLVELNGAVGTGECGFIFPKDGSSDAIRMQLNEFIAKAKADGTLDDIIARWNGTDETLKPTPDYESLSGENGTITVATDSASQPYDYIRDGHLVGMDIEILTDFAKEYGYKLEFSDSGFAGIIASVEAGKADVGACCVAITEERSQTVDFSDPYCEVSAVLLVRAQDAVVSLTAGGSTGGAASGVAAGIAGGSEDSTSADNGFFADVAQSFERTFIKENRWKLVLSGLCVTLVISLLSALFGTLIGFGLCMQRRMKNKLASRTAAVFIRIIQGIPVLVLLMVLYYVVFATGGVSGLVIAVIGFSIDFGVYVAEELRAGIGAIDSSQWEAAIALGFSRSRTFFKVIMPQAIRIVLPVYKGQFISMVKMTSVVGYIAIQDLTKVSDIIRSRTYEALFPLISTAIIYFLLAWVLTMLLSLAEKRMDPKRRKNPFAGMVESATDAAGATLPGVASAAVLKDASQTDAAAAKDMLRTDRATAKDSVGILGKDGSNGEPIISVAHLKKSYPNVTPLSDVNLDVKSGEVIAIIGPSGTGKSTLLRCLNRLEEPTSGTVRVLGQEMGARNVDVNAIRERMVMVFQSFNLFPHLTVMENVCLAPMELKGVTRQQAFDNGMHLLTLVGLAQKWESYPDELSGGQKQRVAIARALAMEPDIVLFDEPTSALDPTMVSEVLCVIRNLAQAGLTMMIVTHEMRFARDVSTRVLYMDEGVIYEDGTPKQVFESPQREKTRVFIQRIHTFSSTFDSPRYDFAALLAQMESFGHREFLAEKRIIALQRTFEELCAVNIIPELAAASTTAATIDLHMTVEHAETDDNVTMHLSYGGPSYNPFDEGDNLSIAIVKGVSKNHTYKSKDGRNEVDIVL